MGACSKWFIKVMGSLQRIWCLRGAPVPLQITSILCEHRSQPAPLFLRLQIMFNWKTMKTKIEGLRLLKWVKNLLFHPARRLRSDVGLRLYVRWPLRWSCSPPSSQTNASRDVSRVQWRPEVEWLLWAYCGLESLSQWAYHFSRGRHLSVRGLPRMVSRFIKWWRTEGGISVLGETKYVAFY